MKLLLRAGYVKVCAEIAAQCMGRGFGCTGFDDLTVPGRQGLFAFSRVTGSCGREEERKTGRGACE